MSSCRSAPPVWLRVAAASSVLAFAVALVGFVLENAYFYGDDYWGFLLARREPLWDQLFEPIALQVAPGYRLGNALLVDVAGLRFGAAVGALLALHALGVAALYRCLSLLQPASQSALEAGAQSRDTSYGIVNTLLTVWYAAHPFLWPLLSWWSAGLHRVPSATSSMFAVYCHLRYSRDGRPRFLFGSWVLVLAALTFSAKAALLPACFIGLDIVAVVSRSRRLDRRMALAWASSATLFALGPSIILLSRHWAGFAPDSSDIHLNFTQQLACQVRSFNIVAQSLFGNSAPYSGYDVSSPALLGWMLLVGYTTYRFKRAPLVWLMLAAQLALHFFVIGSSPRVAMFGPSAVEEPRYFFEVAHLVALFVAAVLHCLPRDSAEFAWLRTSAVAKVAVVFVGVGYAAFSYASSTRAFRVTSSDVLRTKHYMDALRSDLHVLGERSALPAFADGPVPIYVRGLDDRFSRHAQLFEVLGVRAEFVAREQAELEIAANGHIVPISLGRQRYRTN